MTDTALLSERATAWHEFLGSGLCPNCKQGRLSSTARAITHWEQGLPVSDLALAIVPRYKLGSDPFASCSSAAQQSASCLVSCLLGQVY